VQRRRRSRTAATGRSRNRNIVAVVITLPNIFLGFCVAQTRIKDIVNRLGGAQPSNRVANNNDNIIAITCTQKSTTTTIIIIFIIPTICIVEVDNSLR
jgi:hypothetical protein